MYRGRTVWLSLLAILFSASLSLGQAFPQAGPEHEKLKEMVGTWDAAVESGGSTSKGTMTYKMGLGGLWLISEFKGEFGGQEFSGHGLDSYDAVKKKYVSVWVDSMSTTPMMLEGNYDKEGKVLTMIGEATGPDGAKMKIKMVADRVDKDTQKDSMFGIGPDGSETMMMQINYKRRK